MSLPAVPPTIGPNKAIASGLAGAITTIIIWALNTYAQAGIPDFISGSVLTIITTLLVYYVPHGGDA